VVRARDFGQMRVREYLEGWVVKGQMALVGLIDALIYSVAVI
jgi:hypothetical protein